MKKIAVIGIFVLLVAGFAAWVWTLGNVPEDAPPLISLKVSSSSVSVRAPNGTWSAATNGMAISEGWSVKTDGSGRATIAVGDIGETRLDANSEITLSKTSLNAFGNDTDVEFALAAGRAWTRVLRFFDLGSSYAVKTSAVVATVRGTAFETSANADKTTTVAGVEAAVSIRPVGGFVATTTDAIAAGSLAIYGSTGRPAERRAISASERSEAWFNGNLLDDRAFTERAIAARSAFLESLGGRAPGSAVASLADISERVHLAFASETERGRLRERYFARRLMAFVELAENGKSGQAAQEFARLDNEARSSGMSVDDRLRLGRALAAVAPIIESADANSPLFMFRQRVESLAQSVTDPKTPAGVYARLIAVEDQIADAERFIEARSLGDAKTALDGAASGIANVVRESESVIAGFVKEDREEIEAKIASLKARVAAGRIAAQAAEAGSPESATSTEDGAGTQGASTSTADIPEHPASSSTSGEPATVTAIRLATSPSTVNVGKKAVLRVTATLSDGTTRDVSAIAGFSVSTDDVVHLNGMELTGVSRGSAKVTATYAAESGTLTSVATIVVEEKAVPTSLGLTASKGTSLGAGERTNFTAIARRSDGTQSDVTANAAFLLKSGSVGTVQGATFMSTSAGTATITAMYTENEKTVVSSIILTVTGGSTGSPGASSTLGE
jgi:hypothetical protein